MNEENIDCASPNNSEAKLPKTSRPKLTGKGKRKEKSAPPIIPKLNSTYLDSTFKNNLGDAYKNCQPYNDASNTELMVDPFPICVLPNLIADDNFLEGLKYELLDQIFHEKNNDLYKFQQTDDLRKISTPHVKGIRKLLGGEFLRWLQEITGIEFSEKEDVTCSRYDFTDVLLCHDDELEGRKIAFILYLVPPWKEEDGGLLDIFNTDDNCQPKDIVKSLVPAWNKFVFFEVNPVSFHQVSEVLSKDKTRLSVNGWFHAPTKERPPPYVEPKKSLVPHVPLDMDFLYEWINPIYLDIEVQSQIREKFEEDSEIELQEFIKEEKYLEIIKAFQSSDLTWDKVGPPNKRYYYGAVEENLPEIIKQCRTFLMSEALFLVFSNMTGLSLHALAPTSDSESDGEIEAGETSRTDGAKTQRKSSDSDSDQLTDKRRKRRKLEKDTGSSESKESSVGNDEKMQVDDVKGKDGKTKERNPRCRVDIRRWKHGCYTMAFDKDTEAAEYALDAQLFMNCKNWKQTFGGYTSYIASGEDEELLTVIPAENALALVYRDMDTLKFMKHINVISQDEQTNSSTEFYDFSAVYYE